MRSRDFPNRPLGAPMQQNGPRLTPLEEAYNRALSAIETLSPHDRVVVVNRLFRALPPT